MNPHDLRAAQAIYETQVKSLKENKAHLYTLRKAFVNYFNLRKLQSEVV